MKESNQIYITYLHDDLVNGIALPEKFTYPFYYQPHPLAKIAVDELQNYLQQQSDFNHNFGLDIQAQGTVIGKMFGVLVVQDGEGKLGYLSAFSGKLAGSNDHLKFVPPVFNMLIEDSFFLKGQEIINTINQKVKEIEDDETYKCLTKDHQKLTSDSEQEINALKKVLKNNKKTRDIIRNDQKSKLNAQDYALLAADLIRQSLRDKHELNVLSARWQKSITECRSAMARFEDEIDALKSERKERSANLQQQLFDQYVFLNVAKKEKSLGEIFNETVFGKPPTAAGECAAPKLLQYAFLNNFYPVAMAEFWWGASPNSEIRQHKQFYPACTGKCKPILQHMLEGIPVDDNPLLLNPLETDIVDVVYEDESFVIVNKPAGLRSVPGVNIHDSVYTRLKARFANIEPLIVHRLDMGTSGLLVVAKTKDAHKNIQSQFLRRTVTKRYTALLSKAIPGQAGEVNLPLRGDLLNRPQQLVCFEQGKKASTRWEVISRFETTTKVNFWPLTGRTHQLRMHAAHPSGLNAPIVGDDLYGTAASRLYLHAAQLQFIHPVTRQLVNFEVAEDF